jgi:hypothetical protein
MKVPEFPNDPPECSQDAQFSFRSCGILMTFNCERLRRCRKCIRTAWALGFRHSKIIPGRWKLNQKGTHWTFYAPSISCSTPRRVGSIPRDEIRFAFGTSSNCADVETYGTGTITRWKIVRIKRQCVRCETDFEQGPHETQRFCGRCWKDFTEAMSKLSTLSPRQRLDLVDWAHNKKLHNRAELDRGSNVRWVREFAAEGSHTPAQFKALCERYGNICLRCGEKRPLHADHVIPLEKGGTNYITNIQPLCASCNRAKWTDSTDYRNEAQKP